MCWKGFIFSPFFFLFFFSKIAIISTTAFFRSQLGYIFFRIAIIATIVRTKIHVIFRIAIIATNVRIKYQLYHFQNWHNCTIAITMHYTFFRNAKIATIASTRWHLVFFFRIAIIATIATIKIHLLFSRIAKIATIVRIRHQESTI